MSVIPHTQEETTLLRKHTGDIVNLENDMIVRYVEKLMGKENTKGLSLSIFRSKWILKNTYMRLFNELIFN